METKICRICGEEKPITDFPVNSQYIDGYDTRCKGCKNDEARAGYHARKGKLKGGGDPTLADFTPRELIEELRARGYKGTLEFTKTIKL
jgi:hypothetical protein